MQRSFMTALVVLVGTLWTSAAGAVEITSITPSHGPTLGAVPITIFGSDFGASGNSVTVGAHPCPVTLEGSGAIVCTLPEGSGAQQSVRVLDGVGGASNPLPFAYDPPSVTNVSPTSAATLGGVRLTISGANFGPNGLAVAKTVTVGSAACPLDGVASSHELLTCTLPEGQGASLAVGVTVDGQTSTSTGTFSYSPPSLTSVTPSSGGIAGGSIITIRGENFGLQALASVGGSSCPLTQQSHTELRCTLPPGTGSSADVQVSVGGQTSNALAFSYAVAASKCDAGKLKVAADYAKCLAGAAASGAKKGLFGSSKTLVACTDKAGSKCAKAESSFTDCSQPGTCTQLLEATRGWDGTIKGLVQ